MIRRRLWLAGAAAAVALVVAGSVPAEGAGHPATGVGSCTLKGWNPASDPTDAKHLPVGERPQTYRPDNYNCTGAVFAKPGVEFAKFPQPHNYHVTNRHTTQLVRTCKSGVCTEQAKAVWQPTAAVKSRRDARR